MAWYWLVMYVKREVLEMEYIKIRFESRPYGHTAGFVLELGRFEDMSLEEISRLFPYSESLKMKTLLRSKSYPTWEEAFQHNFDDTAK